MTTQAPSTPRIQRILDQLRERLEAEQCNGGERVLTLTVKIRRGVPWKRIIAMQDEEELT